MRQPTPRQKPARAQPVRFTAPIGGWIANRALALGDQQGGPPGAEVLENWFPTSTGIILRRGSQLRSNIGTGRVLSMFKYISGAVSQLFASTTGPIWDITTDTPVATTQTGTNGDWVVQQFGTAGGDFLVGVNGSDPAFLYDGTTWSDAAITFPVGSPLTTADLAYVWSFAGRLWFAQKDSMSAWYLPVDQIGGELEEFPLGGIFTLGGTLVWGQTWSLSSGGAGGLSDQCVFCTTEGEVLAYQGNNPASVDGFSRVGLYRIGEPLGRKALIRTGGDLLIATTVGLVSLAEAVKRDYMALASTAASYPIEEAWNGAVETRVVRDWRCLLWPDAKMTIVSPSRGANDDPMLMVANSNTGAWCNFTNWDISSMETLDGFMYFGDYAGNIWTANVTGIDEENPYTGVCIPLFTDMGSPSARKIAKHGRVIKRSTYPSREKLTATFDFDIEPPAAPNPGTVDEGSVWDIGIWDQARWGVDPGANVTSLWRSLGGSGQDVSIVLQVTSGAITPLDVQIIRIDALYEIAKPIS